MAVAKKVATPAKKIAGRRPAAKKAVAIPDRILAKQISIIVSIGTEDSDRSIEKFFADIEAAIRKGTAVNRVARSSAYYIIDGKVCLPDDYDPKTKGFKPGATPPPWAGGPSPVHAAVKSGLPPVEPKRISREEADRRIAAGKAKNAKPSEDDDFEEIDWDAADAENDEALGAVADESVAELVKTVAKKKVVVKKPVVKTTGSASKTPAKKTTTVRKSTTTKKA